MIAQLIAIALLLIIAGAANGIMDLVSFKYYNSVFIDMNPLYWNPQYSWRKKYVRGIPELGRRKWLWGLINMPVAFTDGWHLMKSVMLWSLTLSIALAFTICMHAKPSFHLPEVIAMLIFSRMLFWLGFYLTYHRLQFKKK